jgi:hypothetical protein
MDHAQSALTMQFLSWVFEKPRTYRDVMDAWRTSCPRLPIWEDAVDAGLVKVKPGKTLPEARVVVTDRGLAALEGSGGTIVCSRGAVELAGCLSGDHPERS